MEGGFLHYMVNPLQAQTSVPLYSQSSPFVRGTGMSLLNLELGEPAGGSNSIAFQKRSAANHHCPLPVRSCTCIYSLGEYIKNARS